MVSVVNGFCNVSHLLLRQGHTDFYSEGIAEVSLAAHDGVWKHTPAIADTWCKWMWITGAAYALHHRIPTSTKTIEDDNWKRILGELNSSHAVSRERVEVQLGEAREYLHVLNAQQDFEALDELSAAWSHLIQPRQIVYV